MPPLLGTTAAQVAAKLVLIVILLVAVGSVISVEVALRRSLTEWEAAFGRKLTVRPTGWYRPAALMGWCVLTCAGVPSATWIVGEAVTDAPGTVLRRCCKAVN